MASPPRPLPIVALLLLLTLILPSPVNAASYYAAPLGNGSTCSSSNPCSLTSGYSKLASGDTLIINSGTYELTSKLVISKSNVTITAAPNTKPLITGDTNHNNKADAGDVPSGNLWDSLIILSGSDITFQYLEVAYSGGQGILSKGANNKMIGNHVHDTWGSAVYVGSQNVAAPNNLVKDNIISRGSEWSYCGGNIASCASNWEAGLAWGSPHSANEPGMAAGIQIIGNTVYNMSGEGVLCMHTNDGLVEGNIVYDNWALDIDLDKCSHTTIRNNLVYYTNNQTWWRYSSGAAGIMLSNETTVANGEPYPCGHNRIVVNNIVVGTSSNFRFWKGDGGSCNSRLDNDLIANNTFVEARGTGVKIDAAAHTNSRFENNLIIQKDNSITTGDPSGVTFSHNLWSHSPGSGFGSSTDIITASGVISNPIFATDKIDTNWYKLLAGSPAINKARVLSEVTSDFFGSTRDSSPDIGAHEIGGSPPPASPSPTPTLPAGNTVILTPVADADVSSTTPSTNHGIATTLAVDGNPTIKTYISFDLTPLTGKVITSAMFAINTTGTNGAESSSPVSLYPLASPPATWTETGITYANAPALGTTPLGSFTPTALSTRYTTPLTGVAPGSPFTVALTTTGSNGAEFASRDSGSGPTLTLTYTQTKPYDYDGDNDVDFADLKLMLTTSFTIFDFNRLVQAL